MKEKDLEKQGYRLVGSHSAIKVCMWCKRSLVDSDVCYKEQFYDTKSHRCVQMTPVLWSCSNRCIWCWRDIEHTSKDFKGKVDDPEEIVDGCIKAHVNYLLGFGGNKKANKKKLKDISNPQQFAISLTGEPTLYPKLPELIDELHDRKINSFLVTNGTNPEMLRKLIGKHEPTQLYVSLPAPNQKIYEKCCSPLIKDGWKKIIESLGLLAVFKCRTAIRLTLVKYENMVNPGGYAKLIDESGADYVECKAYMYVGHSRERLEMKNMPRHHEVMEFAKKIEANSRYKMVDEKKESRVVLLAKS